MKKTQDLITLKDDFKRKSIEKGNKSLEKSKNVRTIYNKKINI